MDYEIKVVPPIELELPRDGASFYEQNFCYEENYIALLRGYIVD